MITDDLFTFPIVMVDGENEERKEKENNLFGKTEETEPEYDIVYGEASYPFYDFKGFEDRWLPTQQSLRKALKQKFDACIVRFDGIGQFLVPMAKEKFKLMIEEFSESRNPEETTEKKNVTIIKFTPDMIADIIKKSDEQGE